MKSVPSSLTQPNAMYPKQRQRESTKEKQKRQPKEVISRHSGQLKPRPFKTSRVKNTSGQLKLIQNKSSRAKSRQVKSSQVKSSNVKSSNVSSGQVKSSPVKPSPAKPRQVSSQIKPGHVTSSQVSSHRSAANTEMAVPHRRPDQAQPSDMLHFRSRRTQTPAERMKKTRKSRGVNVAQGQII